MMKRTLAAVLSALLLFAALPLSAFAAEDSGITGLKATPFSATQIKVSWQGGSPPFRVHYGPVKGVFTYYDEVYENSALLQVAPETNYKISVSQGEEGAQSDLAYATTPRLNSQREYNYKYRNFSLYYTNADSNTDFWDDASRTRVERVQGAMLASAGELRNFFIAVEYTLSRAKTDKNLQAVVVLYPPNSADRYLYSETTSIPGDWTGVRSAYNINHIFQTYLSYNDAFAPGRYAVELYFNGWLGGKTSFTVE